MDRDSRRKAANTDDAALRALAERTARYDKLSRLTPTVVGPCEPPSDAYVPHRRNDRATLSRQAMRDDIRPAAAYRCYPPTGVPSRAGETTACPKSVRHTLPVELSRRGGSTAADQGEMGSVLRVSFRTARQYGDCPRARYYETRRIWGVKCWLFQR